ncbi:MMPL family transporter [uncultured Rhodoblastus sp.]|uniref:hopanoid transporter HpnN n=1 Tax=uncultured Rhodoblastus sp. TaxID=543037 RepID=UPI0025FB0466|nr:MMPL family transporter [uncultured Rhodoblastus sp.]
MLTASIAKLIAFCVRHARVVTAGVLLAGLLATAYAAVHFKITSDTNALLSEHLDWRQREKAIENAFHRFEALYAVVDAPTPELTAQAAAELTRRLQADKTHFVEAVNLAGSAFFARNGLLYLPLDALRTSLSGLEEGAPLIQDLASDMSLRGLVAGLEDGLIGVNAGRTTLDGMAGLFDAASATVEAELAGRPAFFSWRVLAQGRPATASELREVIQIRPVLDFAQVQPGLGASEALRATAAEVAPLYHARVRLTGPVAMADEEFGTIKENAARNGLITAAIVLLILWRALRSWRLIGAVALNIVVGLAITAAVGLAMVGAFNLISVYFAVLFVGIGIDFGIQFAVRARAERHEIDNVAEAVKRAGLHVGAPLTLAGLATAAGFLSFLPTDYKGVSELGLIAGVGMLIAFGVSVTLLPALIVLFGAPGEPEPLGYAALAPVDAWMARHRKAILVTTGVAVVAGLPLFTRLRFDFNPINLRDQRTEAVATYLELSRDPQAGVNSIEVLAPSLSEADRRGLVVAQLPEVAQARTLSNFVPEQQEMKLPLIAAAAKILGPALSPARTETPPTDSENIDALKEAAERLVEAADDPHNSGQTKGIAAAKRLALALGALSRENPGQREQVAMALLQPLSLDLEGLRAALAAEPVTLATLPPELKRDWIAANGAARLSIAPSNLSDDNEVLRQFARAVLKVEPDATEGPVSILQAGDTIVRAFFEAGAWAMLSIALLLFVVLRRVSDVALTLIPLILAGVVTLEITVLIGMPLNFANIIALPLLLGVGVAFKIYYIMAWREGQTNLLQTSLTRAVMFSAATTATAFGSLWFSSHPGTSSMGKLLALSLVCTLAAAVLFQPILMGKPRETAADPDELS